LISETKTQKLEIQSHGLDKQRRLTLPTKVTTYESLQNRNYYEKKGTSGQVTGDYYQVQDVLCIEEERWDGGIPSFCDDEDEETSFICPQPANHSVLPALSHQLPAVAPVALAKDVNTHSNFSATQLLETKLPLAPIRSDSLMLKSRNVGRLSMNSQTVNIQKKCSQRVENIGFGFPLGRRVARVSLAVLPERLVETAEERL